MLVVATTTMVWQTYVFSNADNLEGSYWQTDGKNPVGEPTKFLCIVPAVGEVEEVLYSTVSSLARQNFPAMSILMSIPSWDTETINAGYRVVDRLGDSRIAVSPYYGSTRNKPSQLQAVYESLPVPGSPDAPDVIGIFDAETVTSPKLLSTVDTAFRSEPFPVSVQGSIQLMNVNDTWVSLRCALEYLWWFRSRLHRAVKMGVVPLGGNTVFFKHTYLHQIGGWNTENLAEDAEIGIRISALGPGSIVLGYDPEISSKEEAPLEFSTMIKQRTRWNLGFLQTLRLGTWREFDTSRQRLIAYMTLNMPRIQVFTGISLLLSFISVMAVILTEWSPPMVVTVITMIPAISAIMVLTFDLVALRHLGQEYNIKIKPWTYARLIYTTPVYQIALSWAAIRSEWKYYRKDFGWYKTTHVGRHLVDVNPAPAGSDAV